LNNVSNASSTIALFRSGDELLMVFSCAWNGSLSAFTNVEYARTPEVASYFRKTP
jgi:hypothetical protein